MLLVSLQKSDKLARIMKISFLVEFEKVFRSGDAGGKIIGVFISRGTTQIAISVYDRTGTR